MASSEAKIILRADLGPVVEALQVLVTSTRTVLAALQTALDNLEELRQGGAIGDVSATDPWRCRGCGSSRWVSSWPVRSGGVATRRCERCARLSDSPVPTPAGGAENG